MKINKDSLKARDDNIPKTWEYLRMSSIIASFSTLF